MIEEKNAKEERYMNGEDQRVQSEYEQKRAAIRAYQRKKSRRELFLKLILILCCIAILAVPGGLAWRFFMRRHAKPVQKEVPVPQKIVAEPPEYDAALLSVNEYSRPGTALDKVKGVVIHYTANPGTTAMQNRDYFEGLSLSGETYASSHFVIGIEGELIQCIPCNEISYASNERNEDTVSIECCIPDESGKFTEDTYGTLVHLTAWLMGRYELGISDIIRHYDVTGKACPKYYVEYPAAWETFREDVLHYIDSHGEEVSDAYQDNMN